MHSSLWSVAARRMKRLAWNWGLVSSPLTSGDTEQDLMDLTSISNDGYKKLVRPARSAKCPGCRTS